MRIVLLGAPGSGKRTQTMLMVERYGIPFISTGDLLKTALAEGTALGHQVKEAMEEGRSVMEEVVLELIRERLLQPDANQGFVLDGFPRNILQAITLDELLYEMGQPIELALLIDIETDVLMERLVGRRTCKSCGALYNIFVKPTAVEGVCDQCGGGLRHRADDNEATVSNRLHVYEHLVSPLIKHYTRQKKLQRIDGNGDVNEVFARICHAVDTHDPPTEQRLEPLQPADGGISDEPEYRPSPADIRRHSAVAAELELEQLLEDAEDLPVTKARISAAVKKKTTGKKKVAAKKKVVKDKTKKPGKPAKKAAKVKQPSAAVSTQKATTKHRTAAGQRPAAKKKAPAKKLATKVVKKPTGKAVTAKKTTPKKAVVLQKSTAKKPQKKALPARAVAVKKTARKPVPTKKKVGKKTARKK